MAGLSRATGPKSGHDAQAALERLAGAHSEQALAAVSPGGAGAAYGVSGQTPGQPPSLQDCPECPELVQVPAGRFAMGADRGAPGYEMDEGPVREVTIGRDFAIGRFEVLRREYRAFVEATGHVSQAGYAFFGTVTSVDKRSDWRRNAAGSRDDEPVTCISAEDAAAYVRWLSEKTGETYRLPTEAEFYYAAAGGGESAYPWGDRLEDACAFGNIYDQRAEAERAKPAFEAISCDDGYAALAPAGSFRPNGFGLFDLSGNATEYVGDCYQSNLPDPAETDTPGFADHRCKRVAIKGSGFQSPRSSLQLAERGQANRGNGGTAWQGLRVLRELH
jgi:formylglycine-generating enzyme required for sulfatase activity